MFECYIGNVISSVDSCSPSTAHSFVFLNRLLSPPEKATIQPRWKIEQDRVGSEPKKIARARERRLAMLPCHAYIVMSEKTWLFEETVGSLSKLVQIISIKNNNSSQYIINLRIMTNKIRVVNYTKIITFQLKFNQ